MSEAEPIPISVQEGSDLRGWTLASLISTGAFPPSIVILLVADNFAKANLPPETYCIPPCLMMLSFAIIAKTCHQFRRARKQQAKAELLADNSSTVQPSAEEHHSAEEVKQHFNPADDFDAYIGYGPPRHDQIQEHEPISKFF